MLLINHIKLSVPNVWAYVHMPFKHLSVVLMEQHVFFQLSFIKEVT
jgi:hypothetical protein